MPIVANQSRNGRFIIRAIGSESYIVVGNTSVSNLVSNDDIAPFQNPGGGPQPINFGNSAATANVVITGAHILTLMWNTTGEIQILRGSNVVFDLYGSGEFLLSQHGLAANNPGTDYTAANLVISFVSGNGTIILEGKKTANYNSEY